MWLPSTIGDRRYHTLWTDFSKPYSKKEWRCRNWWRLRLFCPELSGNASIDFGILFFMELSGFEKSIHGVWYLTQLHRILVGEAA